MMSLRGVKGSLNIDTVYSILGSPAKRRIIVFLAEKGAATFSEMRRALKMSVGTLYYNLDGLRDFVTRDEAKRYMLTERGVALYNIIKEGDELIRNMMAGRSLLKRIVDDYIASVLAPHQVATPFYANDRLSAVTLAACMLLGLTSVLSSRLELWLIEVKLTPLMTYKRLLGLVMTPEQALVAEFLSSVALTVLLVYLAARAVVGRARLTLGFVASLLLAYTPIFTYMLIHLALTGYNYPLIPSELALMLAIVQRLLQVVTLGFITATISVFCNTSRERGFLVAAALLYASLLLSPH